MEDTKEEKGNSEKEEERKENEKEEMKESQNIKETNSEEKDNKIKTPEENQNKSKTGSMLHPKGNEIFIGNLSNDVIEEDLSKVFSKYGKILEVRLFKNNF